MSELYNTTILHGDNVAILLVFLFFALSIVVYFGRNKLQKSWFNFKNRRCLDRLGVKQMCNVHMADGLGEYFTIDRLILRPDGITLLMCKPFQGRIFCADHIDEWTQMFGQKSYLFKNPLYDLDIQIRAIKTALETQSVLNNSAAIEVDGFLLFDHLAEFPKGHPERVIQYDNIPASLRCNKKADVDCEVMNAWKRIQESTTLQLSTGTSV